MLPFEGYESRGWVNAQRSDFNRIGLCRQGPVRASGNRLDAGYDLVGRKRFLQVVVGPEVEALDAIVVLAARRQHQHGDVAGFTDPAQQFEPVHLREHEIEQHSMPGLLVELREGLDSGVGAGDGESRVCETCGHELAELAVVVHQKKGKRIGAALCGEVHGVGRGGMSV